MELSQDLTTNPDDSYQSISSGTLFGYNVEIINDLNNDGFDELFISEPYNITAPFNSGDVWVFYGNTTGLNPQPDIRMKGNANDLLDSMSRVQETLIQMGLMIY